MCSAVSSPLLATTLFVVEGNSTLDGGGVRTAAPEDSRTRVSLQRPHCVMALMSQSLQVANNSPPVWDVVLGGGTALLGTILAGGAMMGIIWRDRDKVVALEQSGSACFSTSQRWRLSLQQKP